MMPLLNTEIRVFEGPYTHAHAYTYICTHSRTYTPTHSLTHSLVTTHTHARALPRTHTRMHVHTSSFSLLLSISLFSRLVAPSFTFFHLCTLSIKRIEPGAHYANVLVMLFSSLAWSKRNTDLPVSVSINLM